MLQPLANDQNVTLVKRVQPAPVFGDRDRLGEAIANVLTNAIRYNHPGGRVELSLQTELETVTLRVTDDGPGIPEADRQFIFDRFYRVDKARSRSVDGSGLGLAITKWIIDEHGGAISCRGGEEGGTMFEITLPRYQPSLAAQDVV
jgi:two-component system phosphate regulon sensor histidine kinase PhoR